MSKIRVSGVYEVRNTLDNKVYVGSSINAHRRMAVHKQKLSSGKHESKHMQAAWDKHGRDSFKFKLLLICAPSQLTFFEQRLVDGFRAIEPSYGYNKRLVVESCAGMKLTAEHKAKIAAAVPRGEKHQYFGKRLSDAAYLAASTHKRGKPISDGQKKKISEAQKGRKKPDGFGAKISTARKGIRFSETAKKNMSLGRIGLTLSKEHKENIGKLNYAKAEQIRALFDQGLSHTAIAAQYCVSRKAISKVINRETWT